MTSTSATPAAQNDAPQAPAAQAPAAANTAAPTVIEAARTAHAAWRTRRLEQLVAPLGNLALVETRWLPNGQRLTAEEAASGTADTVTATTLQRTNLDTGEPEYGVRLWDAQSPAIRAFDTVGAFDFDPSWVIEAEFTPVAEDRTIPFEHIRDNGGTRDLVVPGDIRFAKDGVDYTMSAFDDDGTLLLVFGDETNHRTGDGASYGSGRFLFVQRIGSGAGSAVGSGVGNQAGNGAATGDDAVDSGSNGFGEAGRVLLDFNQAFVPPCGFSVQYNCPMPPAQNRFAGPVEAGEQTAVFRDGFDIYTV
ncbi:DUF1684 domain-containing protein [Plantibacter sp. YIM 135249]|uniref:DUF1684 domain-containing protein n=1 Tax=Plantibacter sp. YIM 135249 TaxID=3423918 RepID=UPI003D3380D3